MNNAFGTLLRECRQQSNISAGDLAAKLEKPIGFIKDLEDGKIPPLKPDLIHVVAMLLNVGALTLMEAALESIFSHSIYEVSVEDDEGLVAKVTGYHLDIEFAYSLQDGRNIVGVPFNIPVETLQNLINCLTPKEEWLNTIFLQVPEGTKFLHVKPREIG